MREYRRSRLPQRTPAAKSRMPELLGAHMTDLILVTGASGFVGKWCVVKLLQKGYRVRGTVRSDAKAKQVRETVGALVGADAMARLELVKADILDDKGWPEAMAGVT